MKRKTKFRLGFKNGLLKRQFKMYLGCKWYKVKSKEVKRVLKDIKSFPEEVTDYMLEAKPKDLEEFKYYIDSWLHMESVMTSNKRERYVFGTAKSLFSKMKAQREVYNIIKENK